MRRPGSKFIKWMPKDFPSLIFNERTGMSWFLFAALFQERKPIVSEETLKYVHRMHKRLTYPDVYEKDDEKLIKAFHELKEIHNDFVMELDQQGFWYIGDFDQFFDSFLSFMDERYELWRDQPSVDVTPSWFSIHSVAFARYRGWCYNNYGRRYGGQE